MSVTLGRAVLPQPPTKTVVVYRNGDAFFPGRKFVINQRHMSNFDSFLSSVTSGVEAPFGAVRNVYTPREGHKVFDLEHLQHGERYVAAGAERFKKLDYCQITTKKPQKKRREQILPVVHSRIVVPARWRKIMNESCTINVFTNGDVLVPPARILLPKYTLTNWESIMVMVTEKVHLRTGAVHRLCTLNGTPLRGPVQLENNQYYVAVGAERFRALPYAQWVPRRGHHPNGSGSRASLDHSLGQLGLLQSLKSAVRALQGGGSIRHRRGCSDAQRKASPWLLPLCLPTEDQALGEALPPDIHPPWFEAGPGSWPSLPPSNPLAFAIISQCPPVDSSTLPLERAGDYQLPGPPEPSHTPPWGSSCCAPSAWAARLLRSPTLSLRRPLSQAVFCEDFEQHVARGQMQNPTDSHFYANPERAKQQKQVSKIPLLVSTGDGSVFRAKHKRRELVGASEVQEDRRVKVDLPIDQVEAKVVEEEPYEQRYSRPGSRPHSPARGSNNPSPRRPLSTGSPRTSPMSSGEGRAESGRGTGRTTSSPRERGRQSPPPAEPQETKEEKASTKTCGIRSRMSKFFKESKEPEEESSVVDVAEQTR
ncbi:uncharacterized protein dcdc2c [Aplochiton taeniatus]